jgi:hypothetical protein
MFADEFLTNFRIIDLFNQAVKQDLSTEEIKLGPNYVAVFVVFFESRAVLSVHHAVAVPDFALNGPVSLPQGYFRRIPAVSVNDRRSLEALKLDMPGLGHIFRVVYEPSPFVDFVVVGSHL